MIQDLLSAIYKVFKYDFEKHPELLQQKGLITSEEMKKKKKEVLLKKDISLFDMLETTIKTSLAATKNKDGYNCYKHWDYFVKGEVKRVAMGQTVDSVLVSTANLREEHNKIYSTLSNVLATKTADFGYSGKALKQVMLQVMFAAEAYHSRGAMRHVVGMMQARKLEQKQLTIIDLAASMVENWGDVMKVWLECHENGKQIDAKSCFLSMAKYMHRTFDAMVMLFKANDTDTRDFTLPNALRSIQDVAQVKLDANDVKEIKEHACISLVNKDDIKKKGWLEDLMKEVEEIKKDDSNGITDFARAKLARAYAASWLADKKAGEAEVQNPCTIIGFTRLFKVDLKEDSFKDGIPSDFIPFVFSTVNHLLGQVLILKDNKGNALFDHPDYNVLKGEEGSCLLQKTFNQKLKEQLTTNPSITEAKKIDDQKAKQLAEAEKAKQLAEAGKTPNPTLPETAKATDPNLATVGKTPEQKAVEAAKTAETAGAKPTTVRNLETGLEDDALEDLEGEKRTTQPVVPQVPVAYPYRAVYQRLSKNE
jgi:hypothetical protein